MNLWSRKQWSYAKILDCRDESDESECQLLVLKDGYNKMVPPVQMAPDRTMIPVTVDVSIVLLKIVEIEEENHAIEFQYEIIMKVLNVADLLE